MLSKVIRRKTPFDQILMKFSLFAVIIIVLNFNICTYVCIAIILSIPSCEMKKRKKLHYVLYVNTYKNIILYIHMYVYMYFLKLFYIAFYTYVC